MKREINKPSHITRDNVFDDLGFSPEKAAALKVKSDLFHHILKRAKGFTQPQLQNILDEPQPRISELLHGKISKVSIEKLITYAVRLGSIPQLRLRAKPASHARSGSRNRANLGRAGLAVRSHG